MDAIRSYAENVLKIPNKFYRLGYNIVALSAIPPAISLYNKVPISHVIPASSIGIWIGIFIAVVGAVLIPLSFLNYSLLQFSGLSVFFFKNRKERNSLITSGLNAHVRHPLYLGMLLFFWGLFIANPLTKIFVLCIVVTIYLQIGIQLEEKKLVKTFDPEYKNYINKVSKILPLKK